MHENPHMKTFWLNAHLSPKLASWISQEFNVNCVAVRDLGLRDASDRDIFDEAKNQNAVIMTKDSDFVDLVLRYGSPPQIVLFTMGNTSNSELREILSESFSKVLALLDSGESIVELSS
jgi:predicted nuclease of predicted toxin-antitoxin system